MNTRLLISAAILATPQSAFTANFNSETSILSLDNVTIDHLAYYTDVDIKLNSNLTWGLVKSSQALSPTNTNPIVQSEITGFNGLNPGDIFTLVNGITWRVKPSETLYIAEFAPSTVAIYRTTVDYTMQIDGKLLSVEPYIYSTREQTKIDSIYSQRLFSASSRMWKSLTTLQQPTSYSIDIYDSKYAVIDGRTYRVEVVE